MTAKVPIPPALEPLTSCMVRTILTHYDERLIDYNEAVRLMSDLVACDRADRGERAEQ